MPNEVDIFGRSTDVDEVLTAIQDRVGIVVITGGPGFGKTTVAKKVCHELQATNQDNKTAVLFCSLRNKNNISDAAMAMARVCSKNHAQSPEKPQPWLLNWTKQIKQHVTFVLDNTDDILESEDDRDKFDNMLSEMLLLSEYNINFVITSRKSFKGNDLDSKSLKEVRLKSLSLEDAKAVLLSQVSDIDIKKNLTDTKIDTIAGLCGCLPQALCLIGSLLSDYTEDKLIADLQQQPLAVLKEDESASNCIEKAIKTSFDRLKEEEQECLVLVTVFAGSFDSEAVAALLCYDAIPILRSLKNRSLLEQPVPRRYEIHPLIQSYARQIGKTMYAELIDQGKKLACRHFMLCLAENTNICWSKDGCQKALANFNEDRANFELFLQEKELSFEHLNNIRIRTETEVCQYLEKCLPPSKQLKFLKDLLPFLTSDEKLGEKLKVLCLLSLEFRKKGETAQYERFLDEAKECYNSSGMFDKDKVAKSFFLNSYARFLSCNKKVVEAEKYFTLALEVFKELPDTAYVSKGIILLYAGREDQHNNMRDQAVKKLTKALELFREKLGNHFLTMLLCSVLAECYLFKPEHRFGSEEDIVRSVALYKESFKILNNLGLKDRKESILMITNLGICFQEQGKMDEAKKLYQESFEIAERELDCDHRWKVIVLIQMAYFFQVNKKLVEARELKERAVEMSDRLGLADDNPRNKILLQKIK